MDTPVSDCLNFINWMFELKEEAEWCIPAGMCGFVTFHPLYWKDLYELGYTPREALEVEVSNFEMENNND